MQAANPDERNEQPRPLNAHCDESEKQPQDFQNDAHFSLLSGLSDGQTGGVISSVHRTNTEATAIRSITTTMIFAKGSQFFIPSPGYRGMRGADIQA
jgi:hypothetical protein